MSYYTPKQENCKLLSVWSNKQKISLGTEIINSIEDKCLWVDILKEKGMANDITALQKNKVFYFYYCQCMLST